MPKDDLVYVGHMLATAERATAKLAGVQLAAFLADDTLQLAVTQLVQIIGEAARKVSEPFKARHPNVPWRQIVGMRHRIVHNYIDIDFELVWEVAHGDLPNLIRELKTIMGEPGSQ